MRQRGATPTQIDETFARLTYTTDLPAAVRDADLISESVPESSRSRSPSGARRHGTPRQRTVFTTNTSTLAPSALVGFVDRPQQFLALHFAIGVWDANIGEVMGHPGTDPAVFEQRAHVRRGDRPGAHPDTQGTERLHHQQPARALVHRCTGPAGARRERPPEHRSNLDDHAADRHRALRDDGPHGPRRRAPRRPAARRGRFEGHAAPSTPVHRRAVHPDRVTSASRAVRASTATRIQPSPSRDSSSPISPRRCGAAGGVRHALGVRLVSRAIVSTTRSGTASPSVSRYRCVR